MPTWKITLEYDGTRYRGWQSQKNTDRTVQGTLLRAAHELLGADATLSGAGRTDAGVHALAQVAHLKAQKEHAGRRRGVGAERAPAGRHQRDAVEKAPPRFHARHSATSRTYLYRISRRRTAFDKPFVWWVKDRLDFAAMRRAAKLFEGRHDFRSFCENPEGQESTLVVVEKCDVTEVGPGDPLPDHRVALSLEDGAAARGDARGGRARATSMPRAWRRCCARSPTTTAKWTAPPSGLFLEKVVY